MSVLECEISEMWQFAKIFGRPNVQQEILEFWGMGRSPKRHLMWQKNNKRQGIWPDYVGSVPNNLYSFNRDFARHMSARSLKRINITNTIGTSPEICRLGP